MGVYSLNHDTCSCLHFRRKYAYIMPLRGNEITPSVIITTQLYQDVCVLGGPPQTLLLNNISTFNNPKVHGFNFTPRILQCTRITFSICLFVCLEHIRCFTSAWFSFQLYVTNVCFNETECGTYCSGPSSIWMSNYKSMHFFKVICSGRWSNYILKLLLIQC